MVVLFGISIMFNIVLIDGGFVIIFYGVSCLVINVWKCWFDVDSGFLCFWFFYVLFLVLLRCKCFISYLVFFFVVVNVFL